MVFSASISTRSRRLMPTLAMLRHDLWTLSASWLVRLWLAGSALVTLFVVAVGWGPLQTAPFMAALLFPFLVFPWFLVAIVLGVSPVTGTRAEAVADGILSRPVTRYEFMIASWAARVIVVLGVFFLATVPAIVLVAFAQRKVAADEVTVYGVLASLFLVALVLTFLVSLGFLMGTLLRRPILAIVMLLFLWFPVNLILNVFALEEFSPISLNQALPTLLRQSWRSPEGSAAEYDEKEIEELENVMSVLTGMGPSRPQRDNPKFFEREGFDDFSLFRVTLGYGLPAIAAIGLATLCFCWRDL